MKARDRFGSFCRSAQQAVISLLALILLLVVTGCGDEEPAEEEASDRPDVILVTIDTLRADAPSYAGGPAPTPFLDRLASEGLVFTNAHAHNVVTLPSHANIVTGTLPFEHGVRDNAGFTLPDKSVTIAERLRELGYATGAFVGAFPLDRRYRLDQGFETYDDRYREGSAPTQFIVPERSAEEVLQLATEWWTSSASSPRFLWIHLYDPHAPYEPPPRFAAVSEAAGSEYYGEVSATDDALQRYLRPILEQDRPFLVVTADHGEALGDHGELTHGLFAYEPTLAVPLIVWEPGWVSAGKVGLLVGHIDIVPTILDRLRLEIPSELPGRSLLSTKGDRDLYFESLSASMNRGWAPLVGMIRENWKYIDLPIVELYDLDTDPDETTNLADEERRTLFEIRDQLAEKAPGSKSVEGREVSSEESANLLSLGYVSGAQAKESYTADDDPKNLVKVDSMLHQIVDLYQRGELEEALSIADEVVRRRPDMAVGREMQAFLLQEGEQGEKAAETLREAVRAGTASVAIRKRLGLILSETGQAEEAVEILRPLAAEDDPDMLNAYGIALADTGRLQEAIEQFNRVLQVDSTNATAYQNLGIVALRAGDVPRAEGYLGRALALNDELPLALNALGVVRARKGDMPGAMQAWSRAVTLDPKQYDALLNLAMTATRTGNTALAKRSLEAFVNTAPPERYARELAAARQALAQMQ